MPMPRFRVRSLVLLVAFIALVLTVALLTVENAQLRRLAIANAEIAGRAESRAQQAERDQAQRQQAIAQDLLNQVRQETAGK